MKLQRSLTILLTLIATLVSPLALRADEEAKKKDDTQSAEKEAAKTPQDKDSEKKKDAPNCEKLTLAAWKSFNEGKHQEAIKSTTLCIAAFKKEAQALQKKLAATKTQLPTGAVTDEIGTKIHKNGVLNDIAACYLIQANSYDELGKHDKAKAAFEAAKKLDLGRVWDPEGWFWSPAEAANKRLDELKKASN